MYRTVKDLLAAAFRHEVEMNDNGGPQKVAKYGEFTAPAHLDMSREEKGGQLCLVMLTVNTLPHLERSALWASYICQGAAIEALAGMNMPGVALTLAGKRELVRHWAAGDDGEGSEARKALGLKTHRDIAETEGKSRARITQLAKVVACLCDQQYRRGLSVVELRHMALIDSLSRENAHRVVA